MCGTYHYFCSKLSHLIMKTFEHLLKMANQGESALPSISIATTNTPVNSLLNNTRLIESGATDQMTRNYQSYPTFSLFTLPISISLADGSSTLAIGRDLALKPDLRLINVLLALSFPTNLLSVFKLSMDNHCHVLFTPAHCMFQDATSRRLIGRGSGKVKLYYLAIKKCTPPTAIVSSSKSTAVQWH